MRREADSAGVEGWIIVIRRAETQSEWVARPKLGSLCFTKTNQNKKSSFTVHDQSAERLTQPHLGTTEAEPATFSGVRVFLSNVRSQGIGTQSSSS